MLIGLQKKIRATGRQLVLLAPSAALMQALEMMHLQNFFDAAPDMNSAQDLIAFRTQERAGAVTPSDAAPSSPLLWQGEITAANCDAVWELTQIHLLKPGRRELTIDMGAVRFIDSSGAGIMLRARKFAQQHNIKLKFVGVQDDVLNVLRVTRLDEFLLR
jgi:anti-anti-sigma factor